MATVCSHHFCYCPSFLHESSIKSLPVSLHGIEIAIISQPFPSSWLQTILTTSQTRGTLSYFGIILYKNMVIHSLPKKIHWKSPKKYCFWSKSFLTALTFLSPPPYSQPNRRNRPAMLHHKWPNLGKINQRHGELSVGETCPKTTNGWTPESRCFWKR